MISLLTTFCILTATLYGVWKFLSVMRIEEFYALAKGGVILLIFAIMSSVLLFLFVQLF